MNTISPPKLSLNYQNQTRTFQMARATGSRCGGDGVPGRRRWDVGALSMGDDTERRRRRDAEAEVSQRDAGRFPISIWMELVGGDRSTWVTAAASRATSRVEEDEPRGSRRTGKLSRRNESWIYSSRKTQGSGPQSWTSWAAKERTVLAQGRLPRARLAHGKGRDPSGILGCQRRPKES